MKPDWESAGSWAAASPTISERAGASHLSLSALRSSERLQARGGAVMAALRAPGLDRLHKAGSKLVPKLKLHAFSNTFRPETLSISVYTNLLTSRLVSVGWSVWFTCLLSLLEPKAIGRR